MSKLKTGLFKVEMLKLHSLFIFYINNGLNEELLDV